jgi:hypothetical protein
MLRRVFHILCGTLLALGLLCGVLWLFSRPAILFHHLWAYDTHLRIEQGRALIRRQMTRVPAPVSATSARTQRDWLVAGFTEQRSVWRVDESKAFAYVNSERYIRLGPLSVVLMVISAPWAIVMLRRTRAALVRRHRSRHNLCLTCSYDLRASNERCPECGTAVASSDGAVLQ